MLFYYDHMRPREEDAEPSWEGHPVVSELNVNFPMVDDDMEEARRLAEAVAKKYNAILFDPLDGTYCCGDEL
jgi:hypothetical protein